MLRAAAKNHARVLAVSDPADYAEVIDALRAGEGTTLLEMRRRYAARAYAQTAAYETAVADWCGGEWDRDAGSWLRVAGRRVATLRYGENPHQAAAVYAAGPGRPGALGARPLQGKPLSYQQPPGCGCGVRGGLRIRSRRGRGLRDREACDPFRGGPGPGGRGGVPPGAGRRRDQCLRRGGGVQHGA